MNAITAQSLTKAIHDVTADWIAAGLVKDARGVGDGHCYEMVRAVIERLGLSYPEVDAGRHPLRICDTRDYEREGYDFTISLTALRKAGERIPTDIPSSQLAELLGAAQHQWLKLGGLYFDASAPDGAKRFLQMPFFADQIEGLRRELADLEDNQTSVSYPAP